MRFNIIGVVFSGQEESRNTDAKLGVCKSTQSTAFRAANFLISFTWKFGFTAVFFPPALIVFHKHRSFVFVLPIFRGIKQTTG